MSGIVQDEDVYALTDKGDHELHRTGTALSPTELEVLVLVNGRANVADMVRHARGIEPQAVHAALRKLVTGGFVASKAQVHADVIDAGDFFESKLGPAVGDDSSAHAEADDTHSGLQQQGYYVRISRRARTSRTPPAGRKVTVLAVDDDPDVAKLLGTYLGFEGFEARIATNRAEIVAGLRQAPPPDLVLLDVMLPDVDGFEVLARMRQHPALKSVPVIMLTAKATREAVLKGLHGGADGYVTKPFQVDSLIQAVRVVLGLSVEASTDRFGFEQNEMDADYRRKLPARLDRIEIEQRDLAAGTAPASGLRDLHRELRSIAGSAKMFGLPAVSEAARAAEAFLEPFDAGGNTPAAGEWAAFKLLLERLRSAAS
jgi:two-component system, OmpR family, response regulator